MDSSQSSIDEREKWGHKAEYLLSVLGYMVGLGNLWRFPYICMRNGGGAFLIPYLVTLVLCGLPLFILETAIGQFSGKGFYHVWEICPLFKGIGVGMFIILIVISLYYNMIIGWTLFYIVNSFFNPLPWTTCNNEWNSPYCVEDRMIGHGNTTNGIENTTGVQGVETKWQNESTKMWITAQEDFWQNNALQISTGIEDLGHINWYLVLCLFGAWVIIGLCIIKGIKSVGKVVYVTATLPYILLTIILVKGLTLDGSINGVIQYLKPDFNKILSSQVWIEATIQVFYSMGPGWGTIISLSSFNKFENNFYRDGVVLSFLGEGTSLYSGLVVFTVLGFMATKLSLSIDMIAKSGPGLGFIAYPEALAELPGPNVWAFLFFVMLLTVGLDSQFVACEASINALTDSFPTLRKRRALFTLVFCVVCFLIGLVFCCQGGIYIFQLVDWYIAAIAVPLFAFLECIIFSWIYGLERLSNDMELMTGKRMNMFLRLCLGFVTPLILFGLMIFILIGYQPPTYGSYNYPDVAVGFGIFLSVLPVIPVFVCGIYTVKNAQGDTLLEKIKTSVKPTKQWVPVSKGHQDDYSYEEDTETKFTEKLKVNLIGKS